MGESGQDSSEQIWKDKERGRRWKKEDMNSFQGLGKSLSFKMKVNEPIGTFEILLDLVISWRLSGIFCTSLSRILRVNFEL